MLTLHPKYLKDTKGEETLVTPPAKEFETLMEELEDLEDVKLYDEAEKKDDGERILDAITDLEKNSKPFRI